MLVSKLNHVEIVFFSEINYEKAKMQSIEINFFSELDHAKDIRMLILEMPFEYPSYIKH